MATEEPGTAPAAGLTPLPRIEDIPMRGDGYDADRVREAFEAFRRHAAQLQAQLRVLQAAGRTAAVEPTGHAVRMDSLHLIRAAAEFADTIEIDAQQASAAQLGRTEEEVRRRHRELQDREGEIERYRNESERQRAEIVSAARNEARDVLSNANSEATQELREAEARAARLLEQARHQATELTNAARAEVEQTLEWARAQASSVLQRAQQGAGQLLSSAGLGEEAVSKVADAIVHAAEQAAEAARGPGARARPAESGRPAAVETENKESAPGETEAEPSGEPEGGGSESRPS